MAKIVRFKTEQDEAIAALEGILERAKQGDFKQFVFAAQCDDGDIATAWCNADVGKRQELVAHLQCDIVYAMVEANMDRLVEYI